MFKKRLLFLCTPICVVIAATIVLLCVFLIPRTPKLSVHVNDLSIVVGEEKKVEYQVSIPYAFVTIEVDDEQILKVNNFRVEAFMVGSTTLTVYAFYKNQKVSCSCVVEVKEIEQGSTEPIVPENPDGNEPSDSDSSGGDSQKPVAPTDTEDAPIQFEFEVFEELNCEVVGKVIYLQRGELVAFRLSVSGKTEYKVVSTDADILVKESMLAGSIWDLQAQHSGTLYITIDDKVFGSIGVVVL